LNTPYEGATFQFPKPQPPNYPPYNRIIWAPGFDVSNMLGSSDPLRINSSTGIISGTPEFVGQFLVGVCVDEFRNGVLLSTYCRDFELNVVPCGDIPIADFDAPDLQCNDLTVQFTNKSINAVRYQWFFNWPAAMPGSTATDPSFTFPDTGTYVVALIAFQDDVCKDTTFREVTVRYSGLILDFDLDKFLCGDSVTFVFTDKTTDSISVPELWFWEIIYDTDTLTSTEQNPIFQVPFQKKGKIRLTVTAENGCSETIERDFEADSDMGLIPDFDYVIVKCVDDFDVFVTDNSRDDVGSIISWTYVVESPTLNETLNAPNGKFGKFLGDQTVNITLTIVSDNGCVASIKKTFNLLPPDISFDPDFRIRATECEDKLVLDFIDLSYQGPQYGTPVAWDWTIVFDGGSINSTDQNVIGIEFDTTVVLTITLCVVYEDENGEVVCENNCTTKEITANFIGADFFDLEYTLCARKSVQLNPNNPIPGLIWNWEPDDTLDPNGQVPSPWASPLVTTVYSVTITDPVIDCSVVKEVTVTVIDPDGPADFEFDNQCGTLEVDFTKTSGGDVVEWDFGDGNSSTEGPTTSHTYAMAGTYKVTLYTGGECPDTISKDIVLTFIDLEGFMDTVISCESDTIELNPNGNPNLGYVWEPSNLIIGPNDIMNPITKVTENTRFTVTITDPAIPGCELVKTVDVIVPDPIDLNVDSFLELCKDTTVTFIAESQTAISYVWKDGATMDTLGTGPELELFLDRERVIIVCVEDIYGCTTERSINVRFFQVVFTTDFENPLCIRDTGRIFVGAPDEMRIVKYEWGPADKIIGPRDRRFIDVSPTETTTYTIEITYDDGCVIFGEYTVIVSGFPTPINCSADPDTVLSGSTTMLSVSFDPDYSYQWEPADKVVDPNSHETETVPLTESVQFCVTVTNSDGCEEVCCIPETLVLDISCEESVYLPNAFSPNNDGVNDELYVRVFSAFEISIELIIYNRWGQEVFSTKDPNQRWDGTFKGKDLPTGSYGYYLIIDCDGTEVKKQGNVSIIR